MVMQFIMEEYVEQAMQYALYDRLDDGMYFGRITICKGVIAFGNTIDKCEDELRATLEEWLILGVKLGQSIGQIDLDPVKWHEMTKSEFVTQLHKLGFEGPFMCRQREFMSYHQCRLRIPDDETYSALQMLRLIQVVQEVTCRSVNLNSPNIEGE
mgnify:CR=1 FL=1